MHRIETQIEIHASAATVWEVLIDFVAYPRWNPFVCSIEERTEPGHQLKVFLQPPRSKDMTFRPRVFPKREFRWKEKLLIPRLFNGKHFI